MIFARFAPALAAAIGTRLDRRRRCRRQRRRHDLDHRPRRLARHPAEEHDRAPARRRSAARRSTGSCSTTASDTTKAVTNAKKLVSEDKVDVIIGSSTTPNSLAMREVAAETGTPMISLAASAQIINPTDPKTRWIFKTPQNDALMADAVAVSMKANGIKTMGYIGFADAYGDGWLAEMKRSAQTAGIKIVAEEKYNRNDPSVTGQVLKLISRQSRRDPDRRRRHARRHAAEGARGARLQGQDLPDARRGQSGFPARRRQGRQRRRSCPIGPMLVYEQLPDSNAVKKTAAEYVTKYEQKFGTRTTFGGHLWDAYLLLAKAIPEARRRPSRARRNSAPRCATRSRSPTSSACTACS